MAQRDARPTEPLGWRADIHIAPTAVEVGAKGTTHSALLIPFGSQGEFLDEPVRDGLAG